MKLTIDKEADALYLDLDKTPAVESEEISPGVILDHNSEGKVTSIEPKSRSRGTKIGRRGDQLIPEATLHARAIRHLGEALSRLACLLRNALNLTVRLSIVVR